MISSPAMEFSSESRGLRKKYRPAKEFSNLERADSVEPLPRRDPHPIPSVTGESDVLQGAPPEPFTTANKK